MIYPGVIVRFAEVETVFASPVKGPIALRPRESAGGLEIVMIDPSDRAGAGDVLPSRPIDPTDAAGAQFNPGARAA
jgi:hypothetical protein